MSGSRGSLPLAADHFPRKRQRARGSLNPNDEHNVYRGLIPRQNLPDGLIPGVQQL
jgi:hypothetical protein